MATVTTTTTTTNPHLSLYGHPSPSNDSSSLLINNALNPLPLQSRQLRPPKGPLYVPAALRPTKLPLKTYSSPPTPPQSDHGSVDGSDDTDSRDATFHPIRRPSTLDGRGGGSGSGSSAISKLAEDEWMKHEHLGEVTGLPTRDHWKADSASRSCDSPTCRSSFGLFLRRHHCRHCGHVFCSSHSFHLVPLDQDARFHPDGVLSRACDLCWNAFLRWDETRGSRLSKIQSQLEERAQTPPEEVARDDSSDSNSDSSRDDGVGSEMNGVSSSQHSEIAASVPRDWNWSTF